jgi:hypothetical protein
MQRTGAYAWLYATAFFALSIAQATSQVVSPYLLGLGESFSVNSSIQGRDLSRLLPSVMVLQELAISLGNDISTFIMHTLRPFFPDRSGNTRLRPVVETNMMVRFQFFDLHIIPVLFRIIRDLRLFPVRYRTLGSLAKAVFTSLTLSHEKWRFPMLPGWPRGSP